MKFLPYTIIILTLYYDSDNKFSKDFLRCNQYLNLTGVRLLYEYKNVTIIFVVEITRLYQCSLLSFPFPIFISPLPP